LRLPGAGSLTAGAAISLQAIRIMQTLVFVHGFLGGSAQWNRQRSVFENDFDIVTVDLPGFGANHELEAPSRIGDFAAYVFHRLDAAGIERFHLLGHSMGGMIVQEMARQQLARIDRLVLYGTGPVGAMPGRFEPIAVSKRRAGEDGVEATASRIAATWFLEGSNAEGYADCAEIARQASMQAILAGLSAMESWSGVDFLPRISAPTLVLWGDGDRAYQWSQPEQLWRTIPGARLAVIPGCAHAVHLEKPGLFNAVLQDFLVPA
jgi:pimeloyl-ACP methyl ester carboxylesterase